jgi:parallel beta-helix repeat protein
MKRLVVAATALTALAFAGCSAKTNPVIAPSSSSAALQSTLYWNDGDGPGEYWFEYRPSTNNGWTQTQHQLFGVAHCASNPCSTTYPKTVNDLIGGKEYLYRICGWTTLANGSRSANVCFDKEGAANGSNYTSFFAVDCAKYASTSGSDTTGDGTFSNPYASVQKLADSLSSGQVGCLRGGTYNFDTTYITTPGITLAPWGSVTVNLNGVIKVKPAGAGSTIEGLHLDYANSTSGHGGSPDIYADNVTLFGNEITSDHTGICVQVADYNNLGNPPSGVVIQQNLIHDCGALPANNHEHGIYVSEASGTTIKDNWIYGNADRGIQLYPDAQGSTITGNVIYGNGQGQNFSCDTVSCSKNNSVSGNIIADSSVSWNVYGNSQGASTGTGLGNTLNNNCLHAANSSPGYNSNGGVDVSDEPAFFTESGNVTAAPSFADPANGDFHLSAGDLCLAKYTGTMSLP